jgi:hypothetical protein
MSSYFLGVEMICQDLVGSLHSDSGHIFQQMHRKLVILAEALEELVIVPLALTKIPQIPNKFIWTLLTQSCILDYF